MWACWWRVCPVLRLGLCAWQARPPTSRQAGQGGWPRLLHSASAHRRCLLPHLACLAAAFDGRWLLLAVLNPPSITKSSGFLNLQAPDVLSIGLGGGSRLRFPAQPASAIGGKGAGAAAGPASSAEEGSGSGPDDATAPPAPLACTVGPDSVGARLADEALCAGGATPTATDAAVLLGRMQLVLGGRQAAVGGGLTRQQAEAAWREVQCQLEGCVEQAKTQAGELPMICWG